jgi:hypothetical protein
MRPARKLPAQRSSEALGSDIPYKLQKILGDIEESGRANLTRLTVLKKWFETPSRLLSFGIFIACRASTNKRETKAEERELLRETHDLLTDVDVLGPAIARTDAARLCARLEAFQCQYQKLKWTSVRVIYNMDLFFVESGLRLYLGNGVSPVEGYRLAANYCEHYDPRYGTGLNGPSVARIEELIGFVLAIEDHERRD